MPAFLFKSARLALGSGQRYQTLSIAWVKKIYVHARNARETRATRAMCQNTRATCKTCDTNHISRATAWLARIKHIISALMLPERDHHLYSLHSRVRLSPHTLSADACPLYRHLIIVQGLQWRAGRFESSWAGSTQKWQSRSLARTASQHGLWNH